MYEQVLYAVRKALVRGQLAPGDAFPSVRVKAGTENQSEHSLQDCGRSQDGGHPRGPTGYRNGGERVL